MVIWKGSYYNRKGIRTNSHRGLITYRNRHTGIIRLGNPQGRIIGREVSKAHFYGPDPRRIPRLTRKK